MTRAPDADAQLRWLLDDFVRGTPEVGSAMVVSGDGLVLAASEVIGHELLISPISTGPSLAVFARRRCDMRMVGYEMTLLAARVGHALTPAPRPAQSEPVPKGRS